MRTDPRPNENVARNALVLLHAAPLGDNGGRVMGRADQALERLSYLAAGKSSAAGRKRLAVWSCRSGFGACLRQ